jgi:hypothetical protein
MKALWKGHLPLARAFWEYAVFYVALANLCATVTAFAAIATDLPAALAVMIFLLPVPYIIVAIIGVWRSADAYTGPPHWATLARIAAVGWGGLMTLI